MPDLKKEYKVEFTRRRRAFPFDSRPLAATVGRILADHDFTLGTVSVCVVGDEEMRRLAACYRGACDTTDVLAFDLTDDLPADGVAAEIVVNADLAVCQAPRYGGAAPRELALYVIHGALHLVGFDDINERERRRIRRAESRYLSLLDREPVRPRARRGH